MDGSIAVNIIELLIGIMIFKPFKRFAESLLEWLATADLDKETVIDFLKYNFPEISDYFEMRKNKKNK